MTIIRASHSDIENCSYIDIKMINDKRLSAKARGVMCFIIVEVQQGRRIRVERIVNASQKDGIISVRGALRELTKYKYLILIKGRINNKIQSQYYITDTTMTPPGFVFDSKLTPQLKLEYLLNFMQKEGAKYYSNYLKKLPYKVFLSHWYWGIISLYVRSLHPQCSCGNIKFLQVHHKNYKHHGFEHLYWKEDLIVLCKPCHTKIHKKI
jgi:hypothetical protein